MNDEEKDLGMLSDVADTLLVTVIDALSTRRALALVLALKISEPGFVMESEVSDDGDTDNNAETGGDWYTDSATGEDGVVTKSFISDKVPLTSESAYSDRLEVSEELSTGIWL